MQIIGKTGSKEENRFFGMKKTQNKIRFFFYKKIFNAKWKS